MGVWSGGRYEVVEDFITDDAHHGEGLFGADGVDEHVSMDADEVFGLEDGVLVLAGGVDDFGDKVGALVADGFGEGVFDGGVVRFDEVALDELHREGGFACGKRVSWAGGRGGDGPTEREPTRATLRCLGAGVILEGKKSKVEGGWLVGSRDW